MDLTVYNRQPDREATCPACRAQRDGWSLEDGTPEHTCRTAPSIPRTTIEDQARADEQVLTERETEIRSRRLAEIRSGWR